MESWVADSVDLYYSSDETDPKLILENFRRNPARKCRKEAPSMHEESEECESKFTGGNQADSDNSIDNYHPEIIVIESDSEDDAYEIMNANEFYKFEGESDGTEPMEEIPNYDKDVPEIILIESDSEFVAEDNMNANDLVDIDNISEGKEPTEEWLTENEPSELSDIAGENEVIEPMEDCSAKIESFEDDSINRSNSIDNEDKSE